MSTTEHTGDHAGPGTGIATTAPGGRRALRRYTPVAPTEAAGRRRGRAATVVVAAALVAAVTAATLSGCGIRSTAVPVDAGQPASRTACPPTPGASSAPGSVGEGPAVLTTTAPSDLIAGGPTDLASETPWEALSSALPLLPDARPSEAAAPGGSGSWRAVHGSSAPHRPAPSATARTIRTPAAEGAATAAAAPASSGSPVSSGTSGSSGFSLASCAGASSAGAP